MEADLQNTDSETEKAAIRATLGQVNAYLAENAGLYGIIQGEEKTVQRSLDILEQLGLSGINC